ncbi:helix-turn-helix domain-containing protein [Microbacterium sp. ASV49]|uniref:Helix-turn-helix domain-containing protein n=1 Tax=Microbacterium candidum TaxID=3041922 RepID=A0ABT7N315_9MICO|nr:helix-turn-helix domain-containing protein [Microbacterium sp. ASV49]MDL9981100.1 helix-turn-helix domain-containing protein [Microbacterium sp. ASV49]
MRPRNDLDALGALGDPMRRRLYRLAVDSAEPLTRDAAAEALGIPRSTAAFHLSRLVDAGVLVVERRRPAGRGGPGAGRPANVYTPAADELVGSLPERHYELAGELLAAAAEHAEAEGTNVRRALTHVAPRTGARVGAGSEDLEDALATCGYDPRPDGSGGLTLENCPFHTLAQRYTDLICTTNLSLVEGIAAGVGDDRQPVLDPKPGRCCVTIRAEM